MTNRTTAESGLGKKKNTRKGSLKRKVKKFKRKLTVGGCEAFTIWRGINLNVDILVSNVNI